MLHDMAFRRTGSVAFLIFYSPSVVLSFYFLLFYDSRLLFQFSNAPFILASVVLFAWAFPWCCLSVFSRPVNMLSTQTIMGGKNEYEFLYN